MLWPHCRVRACPTQRPRIATCCLQTAWARLSHSTRRPIRASFLLAAASREPAVLPSWAVHAVPGQAWQAAAGCTRSTFRLVHWRPAASRDRCAAFGALLDGHAP